MCEVQAMSFVCCARTAHLREHGVPRRPEELSEHRCINHISNRTGRVMEWEFARDEQKVDSGQLEQVLTDRTAEQFPILVMYPQSRHISAKVRIFVDWVSELIQRDPFLQTR
jgi:LysR family transcriptional regulator for bpeEF and oprC